MNPDLPEELDHLVSALIDGKLTTEQSRRIETLLSQSPQAVTRYLELLDNHEALCAIYPGEIYAEAVATEVLADQVKLASGNSGSQLGSVGANALNHSGRSNSTLFWAAAAGLLLAVGLSGYFLGTGTQKMAEIGMGAGHDETEQTLSGHATLRRSFDLKWAENSKTYRDGDVLPDGRIAFEEGVAEVEFFCGATLIVEGPAKLDIESDWSVHVVEGRLRAQVPPVARGFLVRTSNSEILDLGTEFALDVSADNARVEVIDGEIALRGGQHDGEHLLTGQSRVLQGVADPVSFDGLSTQRGLDDRRTDSASRRMEQWLSQTKDIANDPRLVAYFPMIHSPVSQGSVSQGSFDRLIYNFAGSDNGRGKALDGVLIGPVEPTIGRFGPESGGLDFDRPGSRVRTQLDGEFAAFTFSCWAKIDSLDQIYNALFMADGYENGEPHWQIRNDGCLMFSVMVDDSKGSHHFSEDEQRFVDTAGLARVYYSEPFWDITKSGQWFHLAAVYDPASRQVKQYVNGELVGADSISDKFFVETLRIGASEIGNWGQPFRKSPAFAVRNLNGTIDELAVYSAALTEKEIRELFQQGKPLGY